MVFSHFLQGIYSRFMAILVLAAFTTTTLCPNPAMAQILLPEPGSMVSLTQAYMPPLLKGVQLDAKNPLRFNFIVSPGDAALSQEKIEAEGMRFVRYFMAGLTLPEDALWVNLSPHESDRIIDDGFAKTEMGEALLSEDYILKQMVASLSYPDNDLGKKFWSKVYEEAQKRLGTTDVPVEAFNKVWIAPQSAVVIEQGAGAFVASTHLKVMLERDYVAEKATDEVYASNHTVTLDPATPQREASEIAARDVLLPILEKEVNEGSSFVALRQIYNAMVLASWYKKALKDSILGKVYADQAKVEGIDTADQGMKDRIYQKYLAAFKAGVYNMVREETAANGEIIPRKYISGGATMRGVASTTEIKAPAQATEQDKQSAMAGAKQGAIALGVDMKENPARVVGTQWKTKVGERLFSGSAGRAKAWIAQEYARVASMNEDVRIDGGTSVQFPREMELLTALSAQVDRAGDAAAGSIVVMASENGEVLSWQTEAAMEGDDYAQGIPEDDGDGSFIEAAMISADELIRRDPTLKVANDADEIRSWKSPHAAPLEKILNGVIKEYDIRGYDGGDDQTFPTQIDPVLWKWFGRALGSVPFTSDRHGRTVALEPGDFFLIAGDNGPSTGGLGEMAGKDGKILPNVIDAVSNGFMDAGINVINLNVVGSGALYSTVASLMEELKKMPKEQFIAKLAQAGINLTDAQYADLKRVKGGAYVTRSHVEVGTNGIKPNIDGITLYGDMLQAMKPYIMNGVYREASPEKRGSMLKADEVRETALDIYAASIRDQFGDLKASLDEVARMAQQQGKPVPQVVVNLSGGSLAATQRANGAKYYPELFKGVLGNHLKDVLRPDGDSWNDNGGLADPTRSDAKALGHPKANITQYSKDHPEEIIVNFDLDADRISIMQNGSLFLGDEMFYPVIEYQLTLDPYAELHRKEVPIYFDSRMKSEFAVKVRKHGGIAKIHPKGHSKVKATIDVTFKKLVDEWAAKTGRPATKEAFLEAHPGFKIVQAEYSTHMFMTDTRGNAFDDAVRFGLFWLQAFAKVQIAKGKSVTMADYIAAEKSDAVSPIPDSQQLKEQRTSVSYVDGSGKVVPVSDEQKKALIYRMTDKVKAYFASRPADFEHISDWQKYEGNKKPFTLVEVEGVYHLFINQPGLEGEIFWGWSNTSNKVAFGTQSSDAGINKLLASVAVKLLLESRQEIAAETDLNWIQIEDLETKALSDLFGGLKAAEIEASVASQYSDVKAAFNALGSEAAMVGINFGPKYPSPEQQEALALALGNGSLEASGSLEEFSRQIEKKLGNGIKVSYLMERRQQLADGVLLVGPSMIESTQDARLLPHARVFEVGFVGQEHFFLTTVPLAANMVANNKGLDLGPNFLSTRLQEELAYALAEIWRQTFVPDQFPRLVSARLPKDVQWTWETVRQVPQGALLISAGEVSRYNGKRLNTTGILKAQVSGVPEPVYLVPMEIRQNASRQVLQEREIAPGVSLSPYGRVTITDDIRKDAYGNSYVDSLDKTRAAELLKNVKDQLETGAMNFDLVLKPQQREWTWARSLLNRAVQLGQFRDVRNDDVQDFLGRHITGSSRADRQKASEWIQAVLDGIGELAMLKEIVPGVTVSDDLVILQDGQKNAALDKGRAADFVADLLSGIRDAKMNFGLSLRPRTSAEALWADLILDQLVRVGGFGEVTRAGGDQFAARDIRNSMQADRVKVSEWLEKVQAGIKAEAAMRKLRSEPVQGGIDLTRQYDLQIKRDQNGIPLPVYEQPLGDMQINGFSAILINSTPVDFGAMVGL